MFIALLHHLLRLLVLSLAATDLGLLQRTASSNIFLSLSQQFMPEISQN